MSFLSKLFGKTDKKTVTAYNFFLAFDFIPKAIERLNNQQATINDVLNFDSIAIEKPNFAKLVKDTKVVSSGVNKWPNLTCYLVNIPSNNVMPEVVTAFIAHDVSLNRAIYFTLEYSIGDFALCAPTPNSHNTLDASIKDGNQFGALCLKMSMKYFNDLIEENF